MFTGKSSYELGTIEEEVKDTLRRGGAGDSEYWEAVLKRLRIWKAKARIHDIHGKLREQMLAERRTAGEEPEPEPEQAVSTHLPKKHTLLTQQKTQRACVRLCRVQSLSFWHSAFSHGVLAAADSKEEE